MVPWAYVIDDLAQTIHQVREDGKLGNSDPISMREITAMADYNLARSRNLFGSLKYAFDQRRNGNRNVPMHMMPDFQLWLKHAQPEVYYHLYGPDPVPPEQFMQKHNSSAARIQDSRSRAQRRADRPVVMAERVDGPKMPSVDDQGRIRHHHTYDTPPEPPVQSYMVRQGQRQPNGSVLNPTPIQPRKPTAVRSDAAEQIRQNVLDAAEKRRRAAAGS